MQEARALLLLQVMLFCMCRKPDPSGGISPLYVQLRAFPLNILHTAAPGDTVPLHRANRLDEVDAH